MTAAAPHPADLAVLAPEPLLTITPERLTRLRRFNVVMAALHFVSATVMWLLANDFAIEVTSFFRTDAPGRNYDPNRLDTVFEFPVAIGTVGFLYLSALFHLVVATVGFGLYQRDLERGMNRLRWVEYSLSSTAMVIVIALLPGVQDIAALVAIAGANVAMIWFGWLMEAINKPGRAVYWTPFIMGSLVGLVPWIAMGIYLFSSPGTPTFVYGIFASIFVFFNCFGINQWLQYAGVGRWRDYVHGEMVYIVLSLAAKSVLAWQIFANTLVA